ncbi:MAG: hypothetical protein ORO03_09655 [Alphaproteobacteria bacterium]|nr:hypothetical protein [Alphaproteobacteria bacterium]
MLTEVLNNSQSILGIMIALGSVLVPLWLAWLELRLRKQFATIKEVDEIRLRLADGDSHFNRLRDDVQQCITKIDSITDDFKKIEDDVKGIDSIKTSVESLGKMLNRVTEQLDTIINAHVVDNIKEVRN